MPKYGIWTPNASVICFNCHGTKFPRKEYETASPEWMHAIDENAPLEEDHAVTKCDVCSCDIQLNEIIAREHNIVLKLREMNIKAHMEQTGGMCNAGGVYATDGYYLFGLEYGFGISKYDTDGEWVEDSGVDFETEEQLIDYIKALPNLKTLKEHKIYFVEGVDGQASIYICAETTADEAIEQATALYKANAMIEKIEVMFGSVLIRTIGGDQNG